MYVLHLNLTRTALVNTYIWTIRHFDCGDEQERDCKQKFLKMNVNFRLGPDRPVKEDHLRRWTTLTGKFPPCPNHSIYVWTEISGNFGIMASTLSKLVEQVFISDQSAIALMKARENLTDVSLSRILVISRQEYTFILSSILYSSSWIINLLLNGLVCNIEEYFFSSLVFWLVLRARQNTAWLLKISHDTSH